MALVALPSSPRWLPASQCVESDEEAGLESHTAIVRFFLISMFLVIFCLLFSFVDYIPVKGEIIWYLSVLGNYRKSLILGN